MRGVNWLGDAVMTTPALLRLREALPGTHIALLTHEKLAGLWTGHPAVDEVIAFGAREGVFSVARRLRTWRHPLTPALSLGGGEGEDSFDAAIVLPNSLRTGLEVALARIPRRIGYAGGGRNWLLTQAVPWRKAVTKMRKRTAGEVRRLISTVKDAQQRVPTTFGAHHVHHYLHLAAALGAKAEPIAPLIAVADTEVAAVKAKFGLPNGLLIGLNAGAEYGPAKRWPAGAFRWMVGELVLDPELGVVIFGGPADVELARSLFPAGASAVRVLAGKTTLPQLAAALQSCAVVVTNDTGPMHLAAAVGTPVLVPFGSTSPELTGPGLPGDPRHRFVRVGVPCGPCFLRTCPVDHRCLEGIAPEWVLSELRAMLG